MMSLTLSIVKIHLRSRKNSTQAIINKRLSRYNKHFESSQKLLKIKDEKRVQCSISVITSAFETS